MSPSLVWNDPDSDHGVLGLQEEFTAIGRRRSDFNSSGMRRPAARPRARRATKGTDSGSPTCGGRGGLRLAPDERCGLDERG